MKILLINDYSVSLGGAEEILSQLRKALVSRGHEVKFFSSDAQADKENPSFADYVCKGAKNSKMQLFRSTYNPSALINLKQALKEFQPDIVHVRMFRWQLSPSILSVLSKIPSIYHIVTYKPICPIGTKLLPNGNLCSMPQGINCLKTKCLSIPAWILFMLQIKLCQKRQQAAFQKIITNSNYMKQKLESEGVRIDQVIYNGTPILNERYHMSEFPSIAFVGRLDKSKGCDLLIKSFHEVQKHFKNLRLEIIGDGPQRQLLEKLSATLNLQSHITFHGHSKDISAISSLQSSWVQVVPSLWAEPFGLSAIEGMMRGQVVLVSNVGGISELVEEGVSGWTFNLGDVDDLSSKLISILRDKRNIEIMGKKARQHALKNFSIEHYTDCVMELYEKMLSENNE